ncbi:MAG: hypothetical protein AABY22_36205 [Nanoarchaeota archaeon]
MEDKIYTADNLPDDFNVSSDKPTEFSPIDPSEIYTIQVLKADTRDNKWYKPEEKDLSKRGEKYQFNFEFAILDDGDFYGRRLWKSTGTYFKPEGKKGPTILYKIITCAIKKLMTWEECYTFNLDSKTFVENIQSNVVGKQLKVAIENITKNGKTYSKITTFNMVKKELPPFDQEKSKQKGEELKLRKLQEKSTENVEPEDVPF